MKVKYIVLFVISCENSQALCAAGKDSSFSPRSYQQRFKTELIPEFHKAAGILWHQEVRTQRDIWKEHVYSNEVMSKETVKKQFVMQFNSDLKNKLKELFKSTHAQVFQNEPAPSNLELLAEQHGNGAFIVNALFVMCVGRNVADSIALAQSKKHTCYLRQMCDCEI